jgi:MFS transporter, SP family, inositol transporter
MSATTMQADRSWRTAFLAGMASYLDAAALVSSGVAISVLYAPALQLTPVLIGMVLACQQLSFAVGALFGGRLGDRFGRRRVLTLALVVYAVGCALMATATSVWMLLPGVVLTGLGVGADLPVALAMANEVAPRQKKGRMVVLSSVMWSLGIASVSLVVSVVGHLGVTGGRILFGGLVVVAVVVLALRFALPESEEWLAARRQADDARRRGESVGAVRFDHVAQVFRRPVVWAVLGTAVYYASWNVGASINGKYGNYIWTQLAGGDVEDFARLALILLPLTFATDLLFMRVVDTRWRRPFTAIGTVLSILAWAPLAFWGASQATMVALVFLFGVGASFAGESLYKVWSQELVPTLLRGTSQGVTMAFTRVIAAVLAFIVPPLLATDPAVVFVGIFVFAIVSAGVWLFWIPRLPKAVDIERAVVVA